MLEEDNTAPCPDYIRYPCLILAFMAVIGAVSFIFSSDKDDIQGITEMAGQTIHNWLDDVL